MCPFQKQKDAVRLLCPRVVRLLPTSVTANVCNDIYKKFNVVGFSRHDVKNKLGNWLQGLDYENTEDLVQI